MMVQSIDKFDDMETYSIYVTDSLRIKSDILSSTVEPLAIGTHASVDAQPCVSVVLKPLGHTLLSADSVWLFIMSLIVAVVIGLVRFRASQFVVQIVSLVASNFHWRSITSSLDIQNFWPSRILHAVFYADISIVIYETIVSLDIRSVMGFSGIPLFGVIVLAVVSFFVF